LLNKGNIQNSELKQIMKIMSEKIMVIQTVMKRKDDITN
jgi:hypothetical protein